MRLFITAACVAAFIGGQVNAARAPQLSLEGAKAVFGAAIRTGTLFNIGTYQFRITRSEARSPRPGVFVVEIETEPVFQK